MDQGEKVRNFGKTVLIQVKNRKKHLKNTRWSIKFTKKAAENIWKADDNSHQARQWLVGPRGFQPAAV
jgi:hypothetical protein